MLFEQFLYEHTHLGSRAVALLPIDRFISAERVGEFLGYGDEFFVFVKVLYGLRLNERILERQLVGSKSHCLALFLCIGDLPGDVQEFLDDLFVGQHSV